MHQIRNERPTEWMLVKVPRITKSGTDTDATALMLRESVREHHFGGEVAIVRRLTGAEVQAIKDAGPQSDFKAVLPLLIAALEHSVPRADHYPEARKRHADALDAARALA